MNKLLYALTALVGLVVLSSWVLSALGYNVNNLMCDEGLRWALLHSAEIFSGHWLGNMVLFCIALGTIPSRPWNYSHKQMAIYLALTWAVILAYVLWPASPIRGIDGGLFPSPFFVSLPTLIPLTIIVVSISINPSKAKELLTTGIQKYAIWIVVYMMASLLYNIIRYIWG